MWLPTPFNETERKLKAGAWSLVLLKTYRADSTFSAVHTLSPILSQPHWIASVATRKRFSTTSSCIIFLTSPSNNHKNTKYIKCSFSFKNLQIKLEYHYKRTREKDHHYRGINGQNHRTRKFLNNKSKNNKVRRDFGKKKLDHCSLYCSKSYKVSIQIGCSASIIRLTSLLGN